MSRRAAACGRRHHSGWGQGGGEGEGEGKGRESPVRVPRRGPMYLGGRDKATPICRGGVSDCFTPLGRCEGLTRKLMI